MMGFQVVSQSRSQVVAERITVVLSHIFGEIEIGALYQLSIAVKQFPLTQQLETAYVYYLTVSEGQKSKQVLS